MADRPITSPAPPPPDTAGPMQRRASASPPVVRETTVPGPIPRWEIPGWRQRFGVVAGVTGRGPVAGSDFDLGLRTSQPVAEVLDRWQRFLGVFEEFPAAVLGRQVHGRRVRYHDRMVPGWLHAGEVDGHSTAVSGLLLLVTVADCVPIYLVDQVNRAVALLHAGWQGVASGVLESGIEALHSAHNSSVENIVMHCGVAISGDCYEVGDEVAARFGKAPGAGGKQLLDLRDHLVEGATRLGVGEVTVSGYCTARDADRFFSHRRSGGHDGRQVAYLGFPAGPAPLTEGEGQ